MSNLIEDYVEIKDVRDKLDSLVELVHKSPSRVFLTRGGEVQAIVLSPRDYQDLWQIELDRDMKLGDEEEARGECISHEEFMREMEQRSAELKKARGQ